MLLRLVGNLTLLFIDYAANCLTNDSAAMIFSVKGGCGEDRPCTLCTGGLVKLSPS